MQFDISLDRFTICPQSETMCQPCLNIVFFAPTLSGSEDLSGPYSAFLSRFESQLAWFRNDGDQMHAKPIPKTSRFEFYEKMKAMLQLPTKRTYIELRSGSLRDEWLPPSFELAFSKSPESNLSLGIKLPLTWLSNVGAAGVDQFIDELIGSNFPYSFGYVGLGLAWNHSIPKGMQFLDQLFSGWLPQYPGLMTPKPSAQIHPAKHGLVDIGWITLLGAAYTETAGGLEEIKQRIGGEYQDQVSMRSLAGGGIAIRAGELPRFGDITNGDHLDIQCAVGKALRCLWNEEMNGVQVVPGFRTTGDFTEQGKWANRFFK